MDFVFSHRTLHYLWEPYQRYHERSISRGSQPNPLALFNPNALLIDVEMWMLLEGTRKINREVRETLNGLKTFVEIREMREIWTQQSNCLTHNQWLTPNSLTLFYCGLKNTNPLFSRIGHPFTIPNLHLFQLIRPKFIGLLTLNRSNVPLCYVISSLINKLKI